MAKSTTTRKTPKSSTRTTRRDGTANKDAGPKRPRTKRSRENTKAGDANIEKIVAKIRKLQERETKSKLAAIQLQVDIGAQLNTLKEAVEHGKWRKLLAELGYEERTAQKLMKLVSDKFADKIRVIDTDLACRLPTDVYKLDVLNRLTKSQLKKSLKAWDTSIETMDRSQLRDAVNSVLAPQKAPQAAQEPGVSESTSEGSGDESPGTQSAATKTTSPVGASGAATTAEGANDAGAGGRKIDSESKTARTASSDNPSTDPLTELLEDCRQAADRKDILVQAIKDKQISKKTAQEAITQIDKTITALNAVKKRLAAIK